MTKINPDQCPECYYSNRAGKGRPIHSQRCSLIDLSSAKYWLAQSNSCMERYRKGLQRWLEQSQRWEAKYRVVKHENNQLRKKLYGK